METIINDLIRVNRCLSVSVEMMEGQGVVVVIICIDIGELCKLLALNIKVVLFFGQSCYHCWLVDDDAPPSWTSSALFHARRVMG